jgi:guanine deaminase
MDERIKNFIGITIEMAVKNVEEGRGGPFAAIVVRNNEIIGSGANSVTTTNDPTAHAEVNAIRDACKNLDTFQLDDCEIYCSCEPCPMCLGAIFWARPAKIYYAATKTEASNAGFDDSFIYKQIDIQPGQRSIPFIHLPDEKLNLPFENWKQKNDKISY